MASDPSQVASNAPGHWEEVVEELLEQAEITRDELAEGRAPLEKAIGLAPITIEDTVEWAGAETIRRFAKALGTIADGKDDPATVARDALDEGA
jgi:hypothetical protein